MVVTRAAISGRTMRAAKAAGARPILLVASRFVRFETGSRRLAVFASQTVVIASGSGSMRIARATASMTGVSRTAVVSRFRNAVVDAARREHRTNSTR